MKSTQQEIKAPAQGGRDKRRLVNYLINPKYQFKYILWLVVSAAIAVILFVSIFFYSVKQNYDLLVGMGPPASLGCSPLIKEDYWKGIFLVPALIIVDAR